MGSIGSGTGGGGSSVRDENIAGTPLIFATASFRGDAIVIDGYSNKKSEGAALRDLAKAVEKYDKDQADYIRDMVKYKEISQIKSNSAIEFGIEWEPVDSASKFSDNDEYETEPANWYLTVHFKKEKK